MGWFRTDGSWLPANSAPPGPPPWTPEFARNQLDVHLGGHVGALEAPLYDIAPDASRPTLVGLRPPRGAEAACNAACNELIVKIAPTSAPQTWKCPSFTPRTIQPNVTHAALRGAVLLPDGRFVPNFGWTPCVCLSAQNVAAYLADGNCGPHVVALPALARTRLLRVYWGGDELGWSVASNSCARLDTTVNAAAAALVELFRGRDEDPYTTGGEKAETRRYAHCFMTDLAGTSTGWDVGRLRIGSVAAFAPLSDANRPVYMPPRRDAFAEPHLPLLPIDAPEAGAILDGPLRVLVRRSQPPFFEYRAAADGRQVEGVLLVNTLSGAAVRVVHPLVLSLRPLLHRRAYGVELSAVACRVALVFGHPSHADADWLCHLRSTDALLARLFPEEHLAAGALVASLPDLLEAGRLPGFERNADQVRDLGPDVLLQNVRTLPSLVYAVMRLLVAHAGKP